MSVPAPIASQLAALNAAITAAGNLKQAPFTVLNTLAWQAQVLASAVEQAIQPNAGVLDTWTPPVGAADIVNDFLGIVESCETQLSLADLEGFVARIAINLENR